MLDWGFCVVSLVICFFYWELVTFSVFRIHACERIIVADFIIEWIFCSVFINFQNGLDVCKLGGLDLLFWGGTQIGSTMTEWGVGTPMQFLFTHRAVDVLLDFFKLFDLFGTFLDLLFVDTGHRVILFEIFLYWAVVDFPEPCFFDFFFLLDAEFLGVL